jgi:predicted Zn-dependent protease
LIRDTFLILTAFLLTGTPAGYALAQSDSLPELGEAATQYLTSQQEADIGKQFLRELLGQDNFVSDPELQHYLNQLGRGVGRNASLQNVTLYFNLLEENELNAFAVPGGYITFNTGLLLTTETESELASVVGHEIAHLSQRHLPRMVARAQAAKLPTTAAILASILVGGQAGIAGVTLANANLLSNQLAYSREFEREADAIGMKLLSDSGFDPSAMAEFFNRLQRFNVISSKDVPEFLRTHPLSYTRIAESESRQKSYPAITHESSFEFHLAKAKIQAIYSGSPGDAIRILEEDIARSEGQQKDAKQYGLTLAKIRLRDYTGAMQTLSPLVTKYPTVPAIQIARAQLTAELGAHEEVVQIYQDLIDRHPEKIFIKYYYIETLLEQGDAAAAKKIARHQLRRTPGEYNLYRKLARANVELDDLVEAHQADAEYLAAIGRYQQAIASLKLALRDNAGNSQYLSQSIESRITSLERISADAKKRQDQG